MFHYHILVLIMCHFSLNLADFKSCLDETDNQVCFKGEKYKKPIPTVLDTLLVLNQIYEIDGNGNSIGIHMEFMTNWTDPHVSFSNTSAVG